MNKIDQMLAVAREIENCKVCKVGKSGKAVVGEGSLEAGIVFIGEAPGRTESETGRPFVGRSGKLLRSMIVSIGLKEEDVYITSPVKYLPDRGTPTSLDIAHGRIHLMKQFEIIKPKLVVLLGRVAAEGVLQRKVQVTKDHGKILKHLPAGKAGVQNDKQKTNYFLTLHPAAVLRFPWKFKMDFEEDFKKLRIILGL